MPRRRHRPPIASSPLTARSYDLLKGEGLVGISTRTLVEHVALYAHDCKTLAELDEARPPTAWRMPADLGLPPGEGWRIVNSPICDLDLTITGRLAAAIAQVFGELEARGITWRPTIIAGEPDFWTADEATTINVPWMLANETLWRMVSDHTELYTMEDVVRILRHEVGHAIGYAFELWREGYWRESFGDFGATYRDTYPVDPESRDFVIHLHAMRVGAHHYAQKHPDEDWAETFAVWLDPASDWRRIYAEWPGALRKLQTVEDLIVNQGRASGTPINQRPGRVRGARDISMTVAEYLGIDQRASVGGTILRRTSAVRNSVVLHELYFDGLARGAGDLGALEQFRRCVSDDYGSFEAWSADMRACVEAADSWALCCYDHRERRVRNFVVDGDQGVPAHASVLLAFDCCAHAYWGDVGGARYAYAAAVWKNISWPVVEARLMLARAASLGGIAALELLMTPTVLITSVPDLGAVQAMPPAQVVTSVPAVVADPAPVAAPLAVPTDPTTP